MKTSFGKMKKNLYEKAKKFFISEWGDEKILLHSEIMIKICLDMIKNTDLKEDVFIIAGWIHDIGRKIDKDKHHIISLEYLDKFLQQNPEFTAIKDDIKDCIKNHRSEGQPKTKYGLVFKAADKISLLHKKWVNERT